MILVIAVYLCWAVFYNIYFLKNNCKLKISILMSLLWGVNLFVSLYLAFLSFMGVSIIFRVGLLCDEDEKTSDRSNKK